MWTVFPWDWDRLVTMVKESGTHGPGSGGVPDFDDLHRTQVLLVLGNDIYLPR